MAESIIVQYLGFEVKDLVREYAFAVLESATEPLHYTLTAAVGRRNPVLSPFAQILWCYSADCEAPKARSSHPEPEVSETLKRRRAV